MRDTAGDIFKKLLPLFFIAQYSFAEFGVGCHKGQEKQKIVSVAS